MNDIKRIQRLTPLLVLAALAFGVGLAVFAYQGSFSRFFADDYCFSAVLKLNSLWDATVFWYMYSSNRAMAMFLVGLSEFFGPASVQYLPLVLLSLWLAAATSFFHRLGSRLGGFPLGTGLLMGAALVYFSVLQAPNRLQSVYWRAGLVTYSFPLVVLTFLASLLLADEAFKRVQPWRTGLALFLAWGAGWCSETFAAYQTGALGLAWVVSLAITVLARSKQAEVSHRARRLLWPLSAALLGSLIAMAAMFVSPANRTRLEVMPATPNFLRLIQLSLQFAADFCVDSLRTQPLPVAVTFCLGITVGVLCLPGRIQKRAWWRGLLLIPLAAYLLVVCVCAPSVYGESSYPEMRALMPARYTFVMLTLVWGVWWGWGLRQAAQIFGPRAAYGFGLAAALLLMASALYPLRGAGSTFEQIPAYSAWAQSWDARDHQLRQAAAAGQREVSVIALDSRDGLLELSDDPAVWMNGCAATYYGVGEIRADQ